MNRMVRLTTLLALGLGIVLGCSTGTTPPGSAPTPPPPAVPPPSATTSAPPATTAPTRPQGLLIDFSEDEFPIPRAKTVLPPDAGRATALKSGLEPGECSHLDPLYALHGHFTRADVNQQLLVLEGRFCGNKVEALHFVLSSADGELALGGTTGDSVVLVEDLNGDGLDDVIVAGTAMHQGYRGMGAEIGTFAAGRWTQLRDLGRVYEDDCGMVRDDTKERVRVFFQTHRDLSTLAGKQYEQPCGAGKQWRFTSDVKLDE